MRRAQLILQAQVVVAKTDADGVGKSLGSKYGVTGFPSEQIFFFSVSASHRASSHGH